MNWIKIEDREPKEGQEVLVKGTYNSDFEEIENSMSFVLYQEIGYSPCSNWNKDWYSNITEWCEVE